MAHDANLRTPSLGGISGDGDAASVIGVHALFREGSTATRFAPAMCPGGLQV